MLSVRVTGLAATCCVLALLLFSLVSISEMMFTYEIDTDSADQPAAATTTTTATTTIAATAQITAATTAVRAMMLQHAAGAGADASAGVTEDAVVLPASPAGAVATASAAAPGPPPPSSVVAATTTESGFTRAHFALGLFQFCWSYHLQERDYDPKRNRSVVVFDFDFHHHCERVSPSCHVDFTPWLDQLITDMGLNVSSIPASVSATFGSIAVVDSCGSLQAARVFVVLGAVLAALAILSHILRWRRRVSMVTVLATSATTALCGLICMALVISLQQNDARMNSISMLTPTQSVQFGLAFGGLVAALIVAAIATAATAFQAAQLSDQQDQATQGRAGQLQHGRQGGIDHDLYRQM